MTILEIEAYIRDRRELKENRKPIEELEKKINSSKDWGEINKIYRSLAYLMGKIIDKRNKKRGIKKVSEKKLLRNFGIWEKNELGLGIPKGEVGGDLMHNILDHCYAFKLEDKEFLVGEPYGVSQEDLSELHKFCEKKGLCFRIGRAAEHFPNETIRIIITKKREKEPNMINLEG